jgi:hypothetical protein
MASPGALINIADLLPKDFKPLSKEQLAELKSIDSPTVANAIEVIPVRPRVQGYCGTGVRCLIEGMGSMVSTRETKRVKGVPIVGLGIHGPE